MKKKDSLNEPINSELNENSYDNADDFTAPPQTIRNKKEINCNEQYQEEKVDNQKQNPSYRQQELKNLKIAFVIALISFLYIFQDIFTRQKFAETSSVIIIDIQKWSINEKFFYKLSLIISESAYVVTGLIVAVVIQWGPDRINTFNYLIVFAFVGNLLSTLKLLYNDPRPYMQFTDIKGKSCSAEYGNPSGHALNTTFAVVYGISVLGNNFYKKYWWFSILMTIYLLWVGFTRIHLGVHGVNQIILGWVYAIFFFCIFRVILFQRINGYIKYFATLPKQKIKKTSIILICVYVTYSLMLMGLFYGIKDTYEDRDDKWDGVIEDVCGVSSVNSIGNKYLYNKCLIDAGICGAAFGLLLGIVITKGSIQNCHIYGKFNSKTSFKVKIERIGFIILIPGTIFGISYLIFRFVDPSIVIWRFFFQLNFVPFVCCLLFVNVTPKLLRRFSLDIEGDFLKINQENQNQIINTESSSNPQKLHSNKQQNDDTVNVQIDQNSKQL